MAQLAAARRYASDKQEEYRAIYKTKVDAVAWFEGRFGKPASRREAGDEEPQGSTSRWGENERFALTGSFRDGRDPTTGQRSTSRRVHFEHKSPDVSLPHRPRLPKTQHVLFPPDPSQRPALQPPIESEPNRSLSRARAAAARSAEYSSRRARAPSRGDVERPAMLRGIGFGGRYGRDVGRDGQYRVSRPTSNKTEDERDRLRRIERLQRALDHEQRQLEDHQSAPRSHTFDLPHRGADRRSDGT